jgi:beta-mannosidase
VKNTKLLWPLMALIILLPGASLAQTRLGKDNSMQRTTISLNSGWHFHQVGKEDWYPAIVPGCVHTDLLANKLIEDPFYRDNEQRQQWIGKTDWEYQTTFNVTPELLKHDHIDLVFEGLDTYANVFLNDASLLNADNMFRTWRVDCKRLLKAGANTLRIRFRSPINEILPVMAKMKYELPASNDQGEKTSPHTRKAPYHYGWDWGPRFVTSGVWRPVSLQAWDQMRIDNLRLITTRLSSDGVNLTAEVEIVSDRKATVNVILNNLSDKVVASQRSANLSPGANRVALYFIVKRPRLWWPNGLGAHPLYDFEARVLANGRIVDRAKSRTGLRSLELRQEKDEAGKSFYFVVNGVPVFAKGGNWIPADSFPTRITKAKYRQLLESVRDTNMNMLRVWGGGIYERDDFYELCDQMGIMVWQDFMFACSMYPGDQVFLDSVRQEATDNVKRLRNHPSIVIWVGNNEIESAWKHWGWKDHLPASLWDDYLKLFHGVLPEVCAREDVSRPYWPSSPSSNLEDDPESQKMGDLHYWQVWHASAPFNEYEKQHPRFMSEYGFQSFPQIETVETYTVPSDHDIKSPVMMAHQRHPRGNQLIREYMLREYPEPKDFESFLYVSQVLQAGGIRIGAEHLRRIMPHNMGSLYWQIDDCWPVASWSSIDYTGRWKALQFYARRFYSEMLVSPYEQNGQLQFHIVSDRPRATASQLKVSVLDFAGHELWSKKESITVAPLSSKSYLAVPTGTLLAGKDRKDVFVLAELLVNGAVVSSHEYFFEPHKNLSLTKPQINAEVVRTPKGFTIALSTDTFARAVYLSAGRQAGRFVDNYFDLIPGKTLTTEFRSASRMTLAEFRKQLKIKSLADAF